MGRAIAYAIDLAAGVDTKARVAADSEIFCVYS